jgi:hypothetical protein
LSAAQSVAALRSADPRLSNLGIDLLSWQDYYNPE